MYKDTLPIPNTLTTQSAAFAPVLAQLHSTVWDKGNENFPPTSFEVVDLRSIGGVANVKAQELHASFNFRYSTEWNHQDLQKEVIRILDKSDIDYEVAWHLSGEPFLTGPGRID